jgi:hypothetical protein
MSLAYFAAPIDDNSTMTDNSGITNNNSDNVLNQKLTSLNNSDSDSENNTGKNPSRFEGKEGFCMPERELNILRGKQSNTIPVLNVRNKFHTEPSDKSSFISDFAIF